MIDRKKAVYDWIDKCPEECLSYMILSSDHHDTIVVEIKIDLEEK